MTTNVAPDPKRPRLESGPSSLDRNKLARKPSPPFWVSLAERSGNFLVHMGQIGRMLYEATVAVFKKAL